MKLPWSFHRILVLGGIFWLLSATVCLGVDFVPLETFDTWPPANWEIIDGGSTTDTWMQDFGTHTSWGTEPLALVDSDAAGSGSTSDEQLITPLLDCSAATVVKLEFDQYFRRYGDEHAFVDVSTDDGETWTTILDQTADIGSEATPDHQTLDLSDACAGQSQVKIRFYYANASYDWYWAVDNVWVYEPDSVCINLPGTSEGMGAAGTVVQYTVGATNCGTETQTFNLEVVSSNWPTEIVDEGGTPVSTITIDPQVTENFYVNVTVEESSAMDTAVIRAFYGTDATEDSIEITTRKVAIIEDFSSDPTGTWTGFESGHWEWGPATASSGCSGGQDPDTDHSPTADNNIVGYAIGGCYTNNMSEEFLTSPAYDLHSADFVYLGFSRWLGVESSSYDHASVEVSNDGTTWVPVWTHDGSSMTDSTWTDVSYDISDVASGQSTVYIRFGMGPSDGSVVYCGWNIDDFYIITLEAGHIVGTVTDDQGPIAGATVTVIETGDTAQTAADGTYSIPLPEGTYSLKCEATGHNTATADNVNLPGGGETTVDFVLTYPEIDVTPDSFNVSLNINSTDEEELTIQNLGNGDLEYNISIDFTSKDMWEVVKDVDVATSTGDQSLLGAEFFNGHIWVTGAASDPNAAPNYLYELSEDGATVINQYEQASSAASDWGYRDLASDGTYLYAGCGNHFYQIDPSNGSVVADVTHSLGIVIRALAYIPETNTFVTGDFSSACIEFSFDGSSVTQIRSFSLGLDGKYGMSYDTVSQGGPFLWVFDQSGSPQTTIFQADISTPGSETLTGVQHTLPLLANLSDQLAGGLFLTTAWDSSKIILGGLVQGTDSGGNSLDKVFGLDLGNWMTWLTIGSYTGTVAPGGSETVPITFDSHSVETPGDYNANIVVTSNDGDESTVTVPATMHVDAPYWFAIDPTYQEGTGEPGASVDYTVTINNIGDNDDVYDLSVGTHSWDISFPNGSTVSVAAGASAEFTVEVAIPSATVPGVSDLGTFTVTSQAVPTMSMDGQVKTTASTSLGSIGGTVTYDGTTPLAGATVSVQGTMLSAVTASDGTYFIDAVPAGNNYTVDCTADGYIPGQQTGVAVTAHQTTEVNFDMLYAEIDVTPLDVYVSMDPDQTHTETGAVQIANLGTGNLDFNTNIDYPGKDADVLIVSDYSDGVTSSPENYESVYQAAVTAAGYSYDTWDHDAQGSPTLADIQSYKAIIWCTGISGSSAASGDTGHTTLTLDEESTLTSWLDLGGKSLCLSGMWIAWNCIADGNAQSQMSSTLFDDYMKLDYPPENFSGWITVNNNWKMNGQGGPIGGDEVWDLNWASAENYPDQLESTAADSNIFDWADAGGTQHHYAGIRYDGGTFRTALLACPIESIGSDADKALFMQRMLDWFTGGGGNGWMSVNPGSGTVVPSGTQLLDLSFDTTGMTEGNYTAQLHITSNDADEPDVVVNVHLTVGNVPTPTPVPPTATPVPPTATPPSCSELSIAEYDIDFDPPNASPGEIVTITALVKNTGTVDVSSTQVRFAYELTPMDTSDDPNMSFIGDPVLLNEIVAGGSQSATIQWDTTGLEPITYPVYVMTTDTVPEECEPGGYTQTDYTVPVKLYSFEAIGGNETVTLNWTTTTEINNQGFYVYRSLSYFDDFQRISDHLIPGAGTSFTRHDYTFTDSDVQNQTVYFYRLAAVDTNGNFEWSPIAAAIPHTSDAEVRLYTGTNRRIYAINDPMGMTFQLMNDGSTTPVQMQIALLINYEYVGDIVPPTLVTIDSGVHIDGDLLEHIWNGLEPTGEYMAVTLLTDPTTNEMIHLDVTDFFFTGK